MSTLLYAPMPNLPWLTLVLFVIGGCIGLLAGYRVGHHNGRIEEQNANTLRLRALQGQLDRIGGTTTLRPLHDVWDPRTQKWVKATQTINWGGPTQ